VEEKAYGNCCRSPSMPSRPVFSYGQLPLFFEKGGRGIGVSVCSFPWVWPLCAMMWWHFPLHMRVAPRGTYPGPEALNIVQCAHYNHKTIAESESFKGFKLLALKKSLSHFPIECTAVHGRLQPEQGTIILLNVIFLSCWHGHHLLAWWYHPNKVEQVAKGL